MMKSTASRGPSSCYRTSGQLLASGLVVLAIIVQVLARVCAQDGPSYEFPSLFPQASLLEKYRTRRVRIISESRDAQGAYSTSKEYIDLDFGRAALIYDNHNPNEQPSHVYAEKETSGYYVYKPFKCKRYHVSEELRAEFDYWYSLNLELVDGTAASTSKHLRVFNIAGMWLHAEHLGKVFKLSTGGDQTWTVHDAINKLDIEFEFSSEQEEPNSVAAAYSLGLLQLVKITVTRNSVLLREINVLSVTYSLDDEVYANLFQLPIGFGCLSDESNWQSVLAELSGGADELQGDLVWASFGLQMARAKLEITAIQHGADGQAEATSETMFVELAHTRVLDNQANLTMTKVQRASGPAGMDHEIRVVSDYFSRVRYTIDALASQCNRSHIGFDDSFDEDDASLVLRFDNGLKLSLQRESLALLFQDKTDLRLAKYSKSFNERLNIRREHYYFERTLGVDWLTLAPSGTRIVRLIRHHLVTTKMDPQDLLAAGGGLAGQTNSRLLSVRLLVLDAETQTRLLESFRINVIAEETPLSENSEAKLFDVSQECFVDDKRMRAGHDYAWLALFYPLDERQLLLLSDNADKVRHKFYRDFVANELSAFRVPRIELMFASSGLKIRMLVLDAPPLELSYEPHPGVSIHVNSGRDSIELAPDLEHCARQCRLNFCQSFTFCERTHACLIGALPVNVHLPQDVVASSGAQRIMASRDCTTFSAPVSRDLPAGKHPFEQRLEELISKLQQENYDAKLIPKAPDEVWQPLSESGLTGAQKLNALRAYKQELEAHFSESGRSMHSLSLRMIINGHLLWAYPSKFTVELDPLEEAELAGDPLSSLQLGQSSLDPDDELSEHPGATAFHNGLSISNFNINAFLMGDGNSGSTATTGVSAKLFAGFTYDQCASACLDSKCGSFSYCAHRKDCIVTDMKTVAEARRRNLVLDDSDCFILERNFLRDFLLFPQKARPVSSAKQTIASAGTLEASECALECIGEKEFRCASFQLCQSNGQRVCLYQKSRFPELQLKLERGAKTPKEFCDHYQRSHLADYVALTHRKLAEGIVERSQAKVTLELGKSVNRCADACSDLDDCSAFEFCARSGPEQLNGQRVAYKRQCKLIQGSLVGAAQKPATLIVVDEPAQEDARVVVDARNNSSGRESATSALFEFSADCSVFALRKFTSQQHLEGLALGEVITVEEKRELDEQTIESISESHMSLGSRYAMERSEFVRHHVERARLHWSLMVSGQANQASRISLVSSARG